MAFTAADAVAECAATTSSPTTAHILPVCEGIEFGGPEDVRSAVLSSLPDMVRDTMPDGDQRTMRVSAKDEKGQTVYSATLKLDGRWGSSN